MRCGCPCRWREWCRCRWREGDWAHAEREVSMSGDSGPLRPVGFWLKLVDRLFDERFRQTLGAGHLTRRHWQLLNVLARGPAPESALDDALAPFLDSRAGETSGRHLEE